MLKAASPSANFSVGQARSIVKDLFTPNPWIYWSDFLLSFSVGLACYALVRPVWTRWSIPVAILLFIISGISFYRVALFTHEMIHFRSASFKVFRVVWNLFCGIPFLMPSFMYYTHTDHHMRKHFGTAQDGEYLPLATTGPWKIVLYMFQPLLIPVMAIVRFLILAPLSWVSPRFRQFVHRRASSLVMDPSYIRPLPTPQVLRVFRLQEVLCFLVCVGVAFRLLGGWMPPTLLLQTYLTSVFILYMNHVRTLGAHRYINSGGEMTFVEQLLDSVNYTRWPLFSELWAPVGLRYHALHHLFPSMPYHNLPRAHRRLMAELPTDSPYRQTESTSLIASIRQLWRESRASTAKASSTLATR